MSIKKEFVPYEESLELKGLGFDEPCFGFWNDNDSKMYYWNDEEIQNERTNKWFLDTEKKFPKISKNGCTAPTFSQAFRWFREVHNLSGIVSQFGYSIENKFGQIVYTIGDDENPLTYEEAELACLRKLIQIIQGGNK